MAFKLWHKANHKEADRTGDYRHIEPRPGFKGKKAWEKRAAEWRRERQRKRRPFVQKKKDEEKATLARRAVVAEAQKEFRARQKAKQEAKKR